MGYLGAQHEIVPAGDFFVVDTQNVGHNSQDLKSIINAIQSSESGIQTDISDLNEKVAALGKTVKLKGRVNTVSDLPSTASVGDTYFVGLETADEFEEYVFTEQSKWERLGSINDIDLSDYVTKSFLSNQLTGYAKLSDIPTVPTNYLTGGSQTTKSTADGGKNIYTFTKSDGTTSTLEVFNGTKGSKGDTGATGPQGPAGTNGTNGKDGVTPTIKAANGTNIGSVGTPAVTASTSGTTTTFTFNYLKGAKGDKGDPGQNATTTSTATQSANGLMSSGDKTKLDGIATGATKVVSSTVSGWGYIQNTDSRLGYPAKIASYINGTLDGMYTTDGNTAKAKTVPSGAVEVSISDLYGRTIKNASSLSHAVVTKINSKINGGGAIDSFDIPQSILSLPDYGVENNYIDFTTGKYHHKWHKATNLVWQHNTAGYFYTSTLASGTYKKKNGETNMIHAMLNIKGGTSAGDIPSGSMRGAGSSANLFARDTTCTTQTEFNNKYQSAEIVYELETEEVIDISDALKSLKCVSGGTINFISAANIDVKNTLKYKKSLTL